MRFGSIITLLAAAAAIFSFGVAANAHQLVYADAYGNLIIHSPSGYKQIIVGKGHLADEVRKEIGEPEIIYAPRHYPNSSGQFDEGAYHGSDYLHLADNATCPPYGGVILKGRAFMYGVNRGEAVYLDRYCRN